MKIKRDDTVLIISGNDKGKRGRVLRVYPEQDRIIVEGVRMMKKHTKPTQRDPQGGIIEREAPLHVSNVMLVDPASDEASRIRTRVEEDGTKERISVKSGNPIPRPQ